MTVDRVWTAIKAARVSRMVAHGEGTGGTEWRREGTGQVTVRPSDLAGIEWRESGSWQEHNERPTSFRNRLRWTWDVAREALQLHHLRRGDGTPVHLVDLAPSGPGRFTSTTPHLCAADRYQAELTVTGESLELRWEVTGPAKHYSLSTTYLP